MIFGGDGPSGLPGCVLIPLSIQLLSNPAEGFEILSEVGVADPLVDGDDLLHEERGEYREALSRMDQGHIVDRDGHPERVA